MGSFLWCGRDGTVLAEIWGNEDYGLYIDLGRTWLWIGWGGKKYCTLRQLYRGSMMMQENPGVQMYFMLMLKCGCVICTVRLYIILLCLSLGKAGPGNWGGNLHWVKSYPHIHLKIQFLQFLNNRNKNFMTFSIFLFTRRWQEIEYGGEIIISTKIATKAAP